MKRSGKFRCVVFLLLAVFSLVNLASGQKVKVRIKDLPEQYQDWLDLVSYIIHPKEKEVFLELSGNRDRDLFIEAFWRQRDPTPGTPENEFKDEHLKRFQEANEKFSRYSVRPGWKTDQGRIYITLGEPASVERYEGNTKIVPCEIWSYYGDVERGLPAHFSLVFYLRSNAGEPRLYNPAADGPAALLFDTAHDMDPFDYETQYEQLYEYAPTLALVSLSLVPGEVPMGFHPSPQSNIIMANIEEFQIKDISPTYATHFLDLKGLVSTDYLVNYIESTSRLDLIRDPQLGITFLHFSIAPEKISVDYYGPNDRYYCNVQLVVSLRQEEDLVFQYTRNFPLYFTEEELQAIRSNGLAIEDSFPVIEGRYKVVILSQNSVGKEFSVYEEDIEVLPDTGRPSINGPFLGFRVDKHPRSVHIPFKILDTKLAIDLKNTYSATDSIVLSFNLTGLTDALRNEGSVRIHVKGMREESPSEKSYTLRLNAYPAGRIVNVVHTIPAADLSPDYYDLEMILEDVAGNALDRKSGQFIVSPLAAVPHPIGNAKGFDLANRFLYFYSLAQQYDKTNETAKAAELFRRAFTLNAAYAPGVIEYANFLHKTKDYQGALDIIEKLIDNEDTKFDYFLIKGNSYFGLARYQEAIDNFLEGNKIYNSDTRLLNSLGLSYFRIGERKLALDTLKASLRLNPDQREIAELVKKIEKELSPF